MGRRLSFEEIVSCRIRRHFAFTEDGVPVPMIRLILERGGKQIHVKRINSMLYVQSGLGSRRVPTKNYGLMGLMYLTSTVSTAASGSDQRLTLENIIDGGNVTFIGTIAAMEIYTGIREGVSGPVKKEIMKALCRDYGVDIDQGD